jgi:hypothetical protein
MGYQPLRFIPPPQNPPQHTLHEAASALSKALATGRYSMSDFTSISAQRADFNVINEQGMELPLSPQIDMLGIPENVQ